MPIVAIEAQICFAEIMDGAHRALRIGGFCYPVSFDAAGAFDNASHRQLLRGLKHMGANARTRRTVRNWLAPRTLHVKMASPTETYFSPIRTITQGLPEGGFISPLFWLICFNRVAVQRRGGEGIANPFEEWGAKTSVSRMTTQYTSLPPL